MVQKAVVVAIIGVLSSGAAVLWGRDALGSPDTASAQYDDCGFGDAGERSITHRRHISCAGAKRVLRQLKDNRRSGTVPMVCGRSRVVDGWRLKNLGRAVDVVMNSYQRGRVSLHYHRIQPPGRRKFCPPPWPHSEGV